jgi:hypothetical protein
MAEDLLGAVQDQLANFAVGLVKRVEGAGSKVIGSGVLLSIEGRRGILTCGHVAEQYSELHQIGLALLIAGTQPRPVVDSSDHAAYLRVEPCERPSRFTSPVLP